MEFRLPDVGEGLDEAEIIEWLVAVGDEVTRDQPLVEILTDKSQAQLPAPTGGLITELGFGVGDRAKVGDILVVIDGGNQPAGLASPSAATPASTRDTPPSVAELTPKPSRRPKASPVVRKRAAAAGVDLALIDGTGPGGRILATDLDAAIARSSAPTGSPMPDRSAVASLPLIESATRPDATERPGQIAAGVHPLRGIRRVTATTMSQAWSTIPHIHGFDEIDATELLAVHGRLKAEAADRGQRLTVLSLLMAAVIQAIRAHPLYNASIDTGADTITAHEDLNLGFAAATGNGLVVPVVRNADRRSLMSLAQEVERLTESARTGTITPEDLRGGTFTVTNFGSLGGRFATPIIRPPEVGIVGFGAVVERPFVVDGAVLARPVLPISTGSDHRLIDGDVSTSFQEHLKKTLSDPSLLLLGA